jgi:ABC-type multidrug transport system fused ATPase/permease subunit
VPGGALAFAALGLAAAVVKGVGGAWAAWEQGAISGEVGADLRLRALDGWLSRHRLRSPRHEDHGSRPALSPNGALAALTHHVGDLEAGLGDGVLGSIRAVVQLVPLALLLVWTAPRLALVAAAAAVLFALGLGGTRKAWKRANERAARHREALLEAANEAVSHAELWTTYGAERRVRGHLASIGRTLARQGARIEASAAALSGANEVLGALGLVVAIAAARAGWLGGDGESGEAVLLPFAVTFFLAYRPIRDLTDARLALVRASVAGDALAALFVAEEPTDPGLASEPPTPDWGLAALEIEDLVLVRGESSPLSLRVPAGAIVAVVGPTGSGKTTLLRTLLGLESAAGGALVYGGAHLEALPSGPRARPFAWVPQDAPLLADTLEANVSLAPGSDDARASLEAIAAGSLVRAVGDARLGPGGRALSGGERQWVSLARAVATRLPVLLLDEPTSGLDPVSQDRVLEAISRLRGTRTVILVTHREEPLRIADAVVRLGGFRPIPARSRRRGRSTYRSTYRSPS